MAKVTHLRSQGSNDLAALRAELMILKARVDAMDHATQNLRARLIDLETLALRANLLAQSPVPSAWRRFVKWVNPIWAE